MLLTSELATNAICHTSTGAGGSFTVLVHHSATAVKITVIDDGAPTSPALTHHGDSEPSGRGLALVDAIADAWGHHGDGRGRAVWFEIGCS